MGLDVPLEVGPVSSSLVEVEFMYMNKVNGSVNLLCMGLYFSCGRVC